MLPYYLDLNGKLQYFIAGTKIPVPFEREEGVQARRSARALSVTLRAPHRCRGKRETTEVEGAHDRHRKTAAASPWKHDSGHHGKAYLRRVLPVSGSMGQSC